TKASDNAGQARKETEPVKDYILLPLWTADLPFSQDPKSSHDDRSKPSSDDGKKVDEDPRKDSEYKDQEKEDNVNNTNNVNAASTNEVNAVGAKTSIKLPFDPNMPALEDISIFDFSRGDEDDDAETDMNNLDTTIQLHKQEECQRIWRNMSLLVLFNKEETIKTFKTACLLTFYHKKNPKRNKKDERGIMIRNKARLVAQRYTQEEGIDYDEVFALVARIEAIRLFLAYASFKDFMMYQMDVKSVFLYGKFKEEVYQKKDGIFISQDKYVGEIPKKFRFTEVKTASTPMETQKPLLKDEDGEELDVHMYRSMIGSLMYLTSSKPDIMFTVCACARYQVNPKVSHLYAIKRIFRYLKGQPKLRLWYPKDSPFDLVAYTDSAYAGARLDRKSTTRDTHNLVTLLSKPAESEGFKQIVDFLNANPIRYALTINPTIYISCIEQRDLQLEDAEGIDCLPNSTIFEQLTLIGSKTTAWNEFSSTIASAIICLATNQMFNFSKYIFESMVKNLDNVGGGPKSQETMGDTIAQTRFENVSKHSNDPLLVRDNTLQSGEDSLKLNELMELSTNLQTRVLDLEKTKTTQAEEIVSL
ncbi:retrovirus-related pol polyprotein from transposon TNT 1-94, partial [Tanacetum coccineum]